MRNAGLFTGLQWSSSLGVFFGQREGWGLVEIRVASCCGQLGTVPEQGSVLDVHGGGRRRHLDDWMM